MSSKRPNVVVIVADQWRGDCLGAEQGPHPVMTPHLDQIGDEGVRFSRAYADCPVCMPQRVTQLTGRVASRFGLTHNFGCRSPVDAARSVPGRLAREAGYQTQAVGKMHFEPSRGRFGFDNVRLHPNDYVNWLEDNGWGGFYRGHGLGGNEVYPAPAPLPERFTHTHWIVDQAIDFLGARDPEAPFFLWVVFEAPHSPFDPPEEYARLYEDLPVPDPVRGDWYENAPPMFGKRRAQKKLDRLTPEMLDAARRRYYGQISHIDYQLGRLFGELMTHGLYHDTAILFTADHGEHLGDHGQFAKTTFLEASARVPLVMRWPSWLQEPTCPAVHEGAVLTADIAPTVLSLAGLAPNQDTDGTVLPPFAEAETGRVVCGECDATAFATDGRMKYIYYVEGGCEQLFDTVDDPQDEHDLGGDPAHANTVQRLRAKLIDHLAKFERPMVENGSLAVGDGAYDPESERRANPWAWRGPMRHGRGYHGWRG